MELETLVDKLLEARRKRKHGVTIGEIQLAAEILMQAHAENAAVLAAMLPEIQIKKP